MNLTAELPAVIQHDVDTEPRVRYALAPPSFAMPRNIADIQTLGTLMIESGFFKDVRSVSQACVKIIAGAALGYDPFTAMNAFHIIEGKVTPTASEIAARIKRSGRYNFRVETLENNGCALVFLEREDGAWVIVGRSEFLEADAKAAGLAGKDVWKKYGRNMYFARALTNGARWYCPDVFGGPVYTAEELGAEVDMSADGELRVVGKAATAQRADAVAGISSETAARVPQDDLLALAETAGAIPHGLDKPAALKAFGAWAATNVAPDLMERERKVLTNEETLTARDMLSILIEERSGSDAPASEAQRGLLFAEMAKQGIKSQKARHDFAKETGVVLPTDEGGKPTFSGITTKQASAMIDALTASAA